MNETFGQWLRRKRKLRGMTMEQVAVEAGISKGYVGHLETSLPNTQGLPSMPTREKVEALAKAIRADVSEALVMAGYAPAQSIDCHDLDGIFVSFDHSLNLTDDEKGELLSAMRLVAKGIMAKRVEQ